MSITDSIKCFVFCILLYCKAYSLMVPHYCIFLRYARYRLLYYFMQSFFCKFRFYDIWRYISNMEHFLLVRIMKYLCRHYILFIILLPNVMSFSKHTYLLYPRLYICCLCSTINFFMANFIFILWEVITKVNKTSQIFTGFPSPWYTFRIVHSIGFGFPMSQKQQQLRKAFLPLFIFQI